MKISILGAGAWGAALAKVLHENGHAVTLWDINADLLAELRQGRSERLLPGAKLPTGWNTETDFDQAVSGREILVMAIPSQFFRSVAVKRPFFAMMSVGNRTSAIDCGRMPMMSAIWLATE